MKWIKRLLIAFAVVVVVFIAAMVLLVTLVDPNDYKQLIVKEVHKATGRELTLEGDIELSLFPWLGLSLGAAQLSNAPGFGKTPFAGIDEAQVRVALLPLFSGEVKADTLRLIGLKVNLSRNKQGVSNWDDLLVKGEELPEASTEPSETPAGDKAPLALAIGGIEVRQASAHWQDAQSGTDVRIAPFNLETGALVIGEPFDLSMDLRAQNREPALEANAKLSGRVSLDPNRQHYRIEKLKLTLNTQGDTLPDGQLDGTLTTDVEADLERQVVRIAPLDIEISALKLQGEIEATQLLDAVQVKGQLSSEEFSPRELLQDLGQIPPQTADSEALETAKIDLAFTGNPEQASLSQLAMVLDDTRITGNAGLKSFQNPRIDFAIAIDGIDVDRYLPPKQDTPPQDKPPAAPTPPAKTGEEVDTEIALPMEMLRSLHMSGKLTAGKLKLANLRLSNLSVTLSAEDGLITLKPVKTSLYKGKLDSSIQLDARKAVPGFGLNNRLENVALGDLIADIQKDKAYIRGVGKLSFNLNTSGKRVSELKNRLNGKIDLSVTDGALRDRELASKVEKVIAFLKGREPAPTGEELIFESLTGSAKINKGVARNDDLNLVTALIFAKGTGAVDLGKEHIDYELGVALASEDKDKERLFVPITMKGPFTDLHYGLDLERVAKERLKKEVDKKTQRAKEEIDQKIKEKQDELQKKLEEQLKGKLKLF